MATIGSDGGSKAIGFVFPVIGGICVALRFYSRRHLKNDLKIDDWLCLPAWVCVTGCCISLLLRAYRGTDDETAAEQQFTAQILGALAIFWAFANTFIKLSILFFYRRVFVGRVFEICNRILIGLCFVWIIYDTLGWLLYCGTDLRANFEGPWNNCPLWGFQLQIGVFALDSLLDLCILILPLPMLFKLQLNTSKKVMLAAIFCLGGVAFFAGLSNTIVQGVFLVQPDFAEKASGGSFFSGEVLFALQYAYQKAGASFLIYNWPTVEVGTGLIACNLPSLSVNVLACLSRSILASWNSSMIKLRQRTSSLSGRKPSWDEERSAELSTVDSNGVHPASDDRQGIAKTVFVQVEHTSGRFA